MTFLWPGLLWLSALLPLAVVGHAALLRRREADAAGGRARSFLAHNTTQRAPSWRRHAGPALLLAALAVLVAAAARPTAMLTLPAQEQTVMLVMDVSGSMQAPDVAPTRIAASQAAAKAFAARLPRGVRVGVVAYADSAQLVQPPTRRRSDVTAAIDALQPQQGTAIGSGILVALGALFPRQRIDMHEARPGAPAAQPLRREGRKPAAEPGPVPPGSFTSAVIVLLTDGQNTIGPEPVDAAQEAASRGVKVYTVGFGKADGQSVDYEGFSILVRLDEDTLRKVAEVTHGEYFHAGSGMELDGVYEGLQGKLVLEKTDTEITALFAAVGALLLVLGMLLAAAGWNRS